MILIADSGSSKCDWVLANKEGIVQSIQTMGFNPWHHAAQLITDKTKEAFETIEVEKITEVYFYGSGSSTSEKKTVVADALKPIFLNAEIHISHDLDACAIAACGSKEGIACILGTGSNICYWNGAEIVPQTAFYGLGYVLGDEGSGCYLGKQLIKDFLYENMPTEISQKLKTNGLSKDEIINKVYNKEGGGNVYLASFTHFIAENRENDYIKNLLFNCFDEFFSTHILKFEKHRQVPVNFVGSIAYLFQNEIKLIAKKYAVSIETIIKQPIENLVAYHLNKL